MRSSEDFSDNGLQQIDVVDQREYAYHGCMDEEAVLGGKFSVDVSIETDFSKSAKSDEC